MVIDDKFYVGGARDRQIIRMVRGIRRFHKVRYVPGVFVVTLPLFDDGILEIYELNELRQKVYRDMENSIHIVGEQENAGEHKVMLESAVYDITTGYMEEIAENGLEATFRALETMDKLLSGSMFVDISNVAIAGVLKVDSDYIAACKEKLANEFAELFTGNSMTVNRAIMAKILSNIPVFFNTTDEIKEYIQGALSRCREQSELLADYIVIKQMMEE